MKNQTIRKSLVARLDVTDIEYEIKRMSVELNYHKSKARIFEQSIRKRQEELDEILGITNSDSENGDIYK
jgi:hypothetical protein